MLINTICVNIILGDTNIKDSQVYNKTVKDMIKFESEMSKLKVYCKCGHSLIIPVFLDKRLCTHCGNYVFRTKLDEYHHRINEQLKRRD